MILTALIIALAIVAVALSTYLFRAASAAGQLRPRIEPMALAAVTNFFDTLGIGSFAPSMAWMKFRNMVPDRIIPMTMLVGYTPPCILQSAIFLFLLGVNVDLGLLVGCVIAIVIGAIIGAPIAARSPVRLVQAIVAGALLLAALFYTLSNLDLMPLGGTSNSLPLPLTVIVILANLLFGILLNFGVGNYAPTLAILSLFGMDPRLAFPIMASGAAFAGSAAAFRLVKLTDLDFRIVIGLALGALPSVLVAAFIVKEMPIETLRWMVVVVVLYAAATLIRSALSPEETSQELELEQGILG